MQTNMSLPLVSTDELDLIVAALAAYKHNKRYRDLYHRLANVHGRKNKIGSAKSAFSKASRQDDLRISIT